MYEGLAEAGRDPTWGVGVSIGAITAALIATPEQIGAACAFLCSESAAQIRGNALPVDDGWLAQ